MNCLALFFRQNQEKIAIVLLSTEFISNMQEWTL